MHKARFGIRTHVGLHPEEPLLSLSPLVYFRIARAAVVLGRTRYSDDGGLHDRALFEHQAFADEQFVDRLEDALSERVLLDQVVELARGTLSFNRG